ncbi:MAG: MFS transporter [Pseudooceanicola sp.]|nr:MFS transporter [Pseudooceanicola sp.]
MQAGMILLCLAYVLSQFFRAFLAVLTGILERDLAMTPEDLATASGFWFLSFSVMQLPVGWLLDRVGPRRTAAAILLVGGGGGAALFAVATTALHVKLAMLLIGVGCSPVLMASYYIFAREFPAARFATLAALMLGAGSAGNLVASYPMALAADTIGWRASLWALSVASALVALGIFLTVRDPKANGQGETGSVLTLLKMPVMWAILPMMLVNYAPTAALRGLWIGPYLGDVFGLGINDVGTATLVMGTAMIVGTFAYGPLDRWLGTRKWLIFGGNIGTCIALAALMVFIDTSPWLSITLIALTGFLGASFPVIIAHGRAFFPPHLVGRGVTLMNLFGIGGVGVVQMASGPIHHAAAASGSPTYPYIVLFGFFTVTLLAGALIYLFSKDSLD